MVKRKKEKKNKFCCVVCQQWRLRGQIVKIKEPGAFLGWVVKTCRKKRCKLDAQAGIFGFPTEQCG